MCFKDKNEVSVSIGDKVTCNGLIYTVQFIESYPCATIAVLENIKTHEVDRLFLRDIIKL
jgi:hypothetical protein